MIEQSSIMARVGKRVVGFKSVDSWEREIVDGIITKKQVTRTRFEDVQHNFNYKAVKSFW